MFFAANDVALFKRAGGLLGGLFGGDGDGDDSNSVGSSATAASTATDLPGGILGGGGLGPVATPSSTPATVSSSSSATETSSATPSSTPSATVASSTSTSSLSSSSSTTSSSSSVSASSTPLSTTTTSSITSAAPSSSVPSAITPASSIFVTSEGSGGVVTITSRVPAAAQATGPSLGSSSATPVAAGFLQNKSAMAGTFTVVGIIALILVFVASTWCIRRNKRNRLLEEAVDWSPSTHLTGATQDQEKGYPTSLHRTNSGISTNSRPGARYPAASAYRDGPPLPSQVVYGNMGAGVNAPYPGYYDKPVPAPPSQVRQYGGPAQPQMQQPYGAANYNQYGAADYHQYQAAYAQPPPPASLQPAQNPYNATSPTALAPPAAPFNRAHARTPSPTDSDMAYLGYVNDPSAPVQIGRKVSLTKATATTVKHRPGQQSPPSGEGPPDDESTTSHGSTAQSALKVVNE